RSIAARTMSVHVLMVCSSGALEVGHPLQREEELLPGGALGGEPLAPLLGQLVVATAPLAGLLDPLALDEPFRLEPVERRIERGDVVGERAIGALADQTADLVAVAGPLLDQGQDEQLGAPLAQLLR